MRQFLLRGGRRGFVATVAAVVFAAGGTTAVAMAVLAEQQAPEPPPSAAGTLGPAPVPAAPGEGSRPTAAAPERPMPATGFVGPLLPRSKPVSLEIPAIGVSSSVQHLGLTAKNTLEVPAKGPRYDDAAWYKLSATPGALGPSILTGHRDSAANGPSVFYRLGDVRPGNRILITRADGVVAIFEVNGVRTYPKDDFPSMRVYGPTNHAALRLITCGGVFDQGRGSYNDNIVVFASLVGSRAAPSA